MAERDFNLEMTGEQVKDALQQLEDRVAEGWAVGEKDGTPVTSGSPYYENNAKYYAEQAGISAQAAADSAATAEQEVEDGIREGIAGAYVQESATPGAVVTFDDGADNIPLKDLKVNLAINQPGTGDPSPSNVRPIYPVTEAEVSRTGKNLLPNTATSKTENGITFTVNADGSVKVVGTATATTYLRLVDDDYTLPNGSYILNGSVGGAGNTYNIYAAYRESGGGALYKVSSNGDSPVWDVTENTDILFVAIRIYSGATVNTTFYPMFRLATETDATFEPYAGQQYLVNIGINQWDEEWESGVYSITVGSPLTKSANANYIRTKNIIPVKPNTNYFCKLKTSYDTIIQVDDGGNVIRQQAAGSDGTKEIITLENAVGLVFYSYGTTYNNDISINYPSRFTSYYPYTGNVVYGGELDVTTGVLTATHKVIDLGSQNWSSGTNSFRALDNSILRIGGSVVPNAACTQYKTASGADVYDGVGDYLFSIGSGYFFTSGSGIVVRDTTYADAETFKTAMSGVFAVCPLATPISIQLTPTEVDTLRGDNVIWADCGDITNCEYRADLKMYIDKVVGA